MTVVTIYLLSLHAYTATGNTVLFSDKYFLMAMCIKKMGSGALVGA